MDYNKFINNKIPFVDNKGFKVEENELHPSTKPHQRDSIIWALRGGKRALFLQFGLGKTHIQMEMARLTKEKKGVKCLIIAPLGVHQEFKVSESKRLGIKIDYVKSNEEVDNCDNIMITNYERVRDNNIDINKFGFVSLDEASVLRSYGSLTYQTFLNSFKNIKYKFVCTATPSPNRYKELIHYGGFLDIMDTGEALTRYFKRDSTKANKLTLYPHKETEFWLWLSSWALFITKPSDLGYSDEGYNLPKMKVVEHEIPVDHTKAFEKKNLYGDIQVFLDYATGLAESAKEKNSSIPVRIDKIKQILNNKNTVIWHDLELERKYLEKIEDVESIYGSQKLEKREQKIIDFSNGNIKYLATKPSISGSGCNFQKHCNKAVFLGLGYKFNDFIQSIHRIYRYGQTKQVEIHLIYLESEREIIKTLFKKWENHNKLLKTMEQIVKKNKLSKNSLNQLKRAIKVDRQEVKGNNFTAVNNDCVLETEQMQDNSIDLIITSIPFSNHYEYTPSYLDFGHTQSDKHFFEQMNYLSENLLRILKPGRVLAVHVKDRILFGNATGLGMPTVNPFHAKTIFHYQDHGFAFFGQITIETDVVRENNQTYRLGWSEQCKDGSKMGVGSPEYVLLFRKLPTDTSKAYADEKVIKSKDEYKRGKWQIDARAKWNSSGDRYMYIDELKEYDLQTANNLYSELMKDKIYDYNKQVEIATCFEDKNKLPATFETFKVPARYDYVWSDINRMNTLNTNQTSSKKVNHICPLQIDIVDRLITRFSNKGEIILDPFGGLMTVPLRALKNGRKGKGIELNSEYFKDGVHYLKALEEKQSMPTLFEIEGI